MGRADEVGAEVSEPSVDSGRGEPAGVGGLLSGAPEVSGGPAEEAEAGVGGDDDPGPAVADLGVVGRTEAVLGHSVRSTGVLTDPSAHSNASTSSDSSSLRGYRSGSGGVPRSDECGPVPECGRAGSGGA
ncbi:Hypothetical protein SCLAV_p0098 (plasmid) [Streptomyces clavuligerus]|uniref:Uncharacterized protein n=2 Tax=Streptomyces clavuligerus TaxID=1901 RepID=B5GW09_STRCL|nr:hypothetical protein SSCG_03652 [Streptomyces clavuligerus]EFG03589.1 Hypothetical protein SCLAV_p0098 [Streptomyces clavuligerus]